MNTVGVRAAWFFLKPVLVGAGAVLAALWLAIFMCINLLVEACDAEAR